MNGTLVAALQRLAPHHHKRTLHAVQLIFLGLSLEVDCLS
jgi:hypothetical protein